MRPVTVTADELISALRARGIRITDQRRTICEALVAHQGDDLTVADLSRAVAATGGDADPSTVYRTLELLQREGLLRHVHLGHGPGSYHLGAADGVHHVVCDACGRSVHLASSAVDSVLQPLLERHGYTSASAHFGLVALCNRCAAEE